MYFANVVGLNYCFSHHSTLLNDSTNDFVNQISRGKVNFTKYVFVRPKYIYFKMEQVFYDP